ncbi:MAG: sigma-70 family RNA polymerase sigma factor [Myxococcota bacterium]
MSALNPPPVPCRKSLVARLYREHGPAVFSRCHRLLKDASLAEDATQEVFIRVLRHVDSAPPETAVLAWLLRISTNYCLNSIRDDRRRRTARLRNPPDDLTPPAQATLVERQLARCLVATAPEKLRTPAQLYFFDELAQAEVAAALRVTRRTVISRLKDFVSHARARASPSRS